MLPSESSRLVSPSFQKTNDSRKHQIPNDGKTTISQIFLRVCIVIAAVLLIGSSIKTISSSPALNSNYMETMERVIDDKYVNGFDEAIHKYGSSSNRFSETKTSKKTTPAAALLRDVSNHRHHDELVYFNHSEAFNMIMSTDKYSSSNDFFLYQQGWEAQITQAYCAVASSAAVLNSLRGHLTLPQDEIYIPFPWATQHSLVMNKCFQMKVLPPNIANDPKLFFGLGMPMVELLLNCLLSEENYQVTVHYVNPETTSVREVRKNIKDALFDEKSRVFINYDRGGISQGPFGHGHFSPIGAYNHETDMFLIMDIAKYKYPAVWAPTQNLYNGISTYDYCSNFTYPETKPDLSDKSIQEFYDELGCTASYRGYIVVTSLS